MKNLDTKEAEQKFALKNDIVQTIIYLSIVVGVMFLVNLFSGPLNPNIVEHHYTWDPKTYGLAVEPLKKNITKQKPDLILLGNSQLRHSIDSKKFIELTNVPTIRIFFGGSGPAWWYLVMKNVIDKAKHKPKKIAIFFSDNMLTDTERGVKGRHQLVADMMTVAEEPLLDWLSFLEGMTKEEYFMNSHWSTFQKRNKFKTGFEIQTKEILGKTLLGMEKEEIDIAIDNVFDYDKMDKSLFNNRFQIEIDTESDLEKKALNFDEKLPNSYLPEIVRYANQNEIQLIFVRAPKRSDLEGIPESIEMIQYISDLQKYCEEQNILLLDFSKNTQLSLSHFNDNVHLNKEGQKIFTQIFADEIEPYVQDIKKPEKITRKYSDIGI
ncbi:MAG: hypothetical protein R3E32_21125 [Chitinophagales bacterium]